MRRFLLPFGLAAAFFSPCAVAQLSSHAGASHWGILDAARLAAEPDAPPPAPQAQAANPAAEPAGLLTLDTALSLAAARNYDLSAAAREIDALEGRVVQAGLLPNPEFSMEMEDTRRDTRTTSGRLSIPIELGGKRAARVSAAELARSVAIEKLTGARANVRASTVAAFFNTLVAQERLKLAAASAELAVKGTQVAARRVTAGKVAPLEETRARVEQANAELEIAEAAAVLDNARRQLTTLWGNPSPVFEQAAGNLEILPSRPPAGELLQALAEAPELAIGRMEIQRRKAVAEVERRKRYPDIRLTAGSQRNNELGRNQTLVGIAIPLPLFDRNQGNLYEALMLADQSEDQYSAMQIRLQSELQQASTQLAMFRASADTLKTVVLPGAQQAYDAASKGFEAGKFGFLEVLDSQRTLFQVRIRYLTSLASTYQAAIAIDRILGR